MKEKYKFEAVIFAALPPPLGGVSSLVEMLAQSLANIHSIVFASPLAKQGGLTGKLRPLTNLWRLARASQCITHGGRVLFFSSAGASFYEKLTWLLLMRIFGRHAVMVMVDGNFPDFWLKMPLLMKNFVRGIINCRYCTIGVQSEQWQKYYGNIFPSSRCVILNASVAREYRATTVARSSSTEAKILYVGWMIREKGVIDLLDAFQKINILYPQARLRMVGPLYIGIEYWLKEVRKRNIEGKIEFVGSIHDRRLLINEFRAATIFVLPSHFEGFPVALLEAMSQGLPCIGSAVGGIPDILDHGSSGVIVPSKNPLALAHAIEDLLSDVAKREMISSNAFNRVNNEYSEEKFVSSYLRIMNINQDSGC